MATSWTDPFDQLPVIDMNTSGSSGASTYGSSGFGSALPPQPPPYNPQPSAYGSSSSGFGSTQPSTYGSSSSGFGPTQPSAYGSSSSGFGPTQPSAYGSSSSGFGSTQPSAYGSSSSGFGPTQPSTYGSSSSGFGSPQQPQPPSSSSSTSSIPKYIVIDGVRQKNPALTGGSTTSKPNTLLVISNMDQHADLNASSMQSGCGKVPLSAATEATFDILQDPETCSKVGLNPDQIIDHLGAIFVKHEIPMGLMNKLSLLSDYHGLQFIIDDSGSMANTSDPINGRPQTRWTEALHRLKEMFEIIACVPTPPIEIMFLNRPDVLTFSRHGESPDVFLQNVYQQLDRVFARGPSGSTPIRKCLEKVFARGRGMKISRYLFCDGEPDGGQPAKDAICHMVKTRQDPQGNPLALISCTSNDEEVEWLKNLEEISPYTSELDDYNSERLEVQRDQGTFLPYTRGFHLISQLVAAMNPDDLDAMDESAPFTKWTIDNIFGIETTPQEYRLYFEGFTHAQRTRKIEDAGDRLKASFNWEPYYNEFLSNRLSKNIRAVQDFKRRLESSTPASVIDVTRSFFSSLF